MSATELRQTADVSRRPYELSASPAETVNSASRPSKIQPWHLARLAFVYVRQSSPHQVVHHKESAQVQAKLRDLAIAWGWSPDRVIVITDDQGHSGTTADGRFGFIQIMTEVNLDHAGIILGFQVSRLSRANKDWYDLLDRCAVFDTLLADEDGLYSPITYNDRLLLGLKGTMSEAELHLLCQRLYQGRLNKARRGEQFTSAPTGYVRSQSRDRLELDPDEQVQYVIRLIFDKFDELGSIGAVHRYLVRHDIKVGFRLPGAAGAGRLEWRPASAYALGRILKHPYYAGCYAFGFTRQDARRKKPGRPRCGTIQVPRLQWEVMIPDAVPAFITWDRYLANWRRLESNRFLPNTPGAPRNGPALLSGLVHCGRCGQKMRVAYHAKGVPVYYVCADRHVKPLEPACQCFTGKQLENLVAAEVLKAIEPARLELHEQALADLRRERQRLDGHWQKRLERAQIQADRAARQYHAVEPEDRLVARELERRWEETLREQRDLKEQYDRFVAEQPPVITADDRRRIEALAADIPALWRAGTTTVQDRQTIVRCLVERVTVAIRGKSEWVDVTIRWAGGMESRHVIRRGVLQYEQLSNYEALRDRIVALRQAGVTTADIAEQLNREGFYPPRAESQFHRGHVKAFLLKYALLRPGGSPRIDEAKLGPHEWRLGGLAKELGMPPMTLRNWHNRGWITGRKSSPIGGCWILWADTRELERLRRLRAWKRRGYNCECPKELRTPSNSKCHQPRRGANSSRQSRSNPPSGRGCKRK
jgi:DNA invertase Pin-like site-specific DNA recombinase